MKITVKGTNLDITPAINEYLTMKLEVLDRLLGQYVKEGVAEARVELARTTSHHHSGDVFRAEANIRLPGTLLRADATAEDMRSAIDLLEGKLQKQALKYKEIATDH